MFFEEEQNGVFLFNLRNLVNVTEINTYSRHSNVRTPQRYRLYASDDPLAPSTTGNLIANGWELLTQVNMLTTDLPIDDPGTTNGIAGVHIADDGGGSLGQFRYLLFDILGVHTGGKYGTLYSEIDIVGSASPMVFPRCDFNRDQRCDVIDIDLLMATGDLVAGVTVNASTVDFDLDADDRIDQTDLSLWLLDAARNTFPVTFHHGDASLDGTFDSGDLVQVFQAGEYEDDVAGNSSWSTGDWDGDGDFTTSDLVVAFQEGGYEQGPGIDMVAVPEPSSVLLLVTGLIAVAICARRHRS